MVERLLGQALRRLLLFFVGLLRCPILHVEIGQHTTVNSLSRLV